MNPAVTEEQVRQWRDRIYKTEPRWGTESGWAAVRDNWMKPENIAWLRAQPQNQPSLSSRPSREPQS